MFNLDLLEDKEALLQVINHLKTEVEELKQELHKLKYPDSIGLPSRPQKTIIERPGT